CSAARTRKARGRSNPISSASGKSSPATRRSSSRSGAADRHVLMDVIPAKAEIYLDLIPMATKQMDSAFAGMTAKLKTARTLCELGLRKHGFDLGVVAVVRLRLDLQHVGQQRINIHIVEFRHDEAAPECRAVRDEQGAHFWIVI